MELTVPNYRPPSEDVARMRAALQEALQAIDETLEQFARDSTTILQRVEASVAQVRDILIAHHREAQADKVREAVRRVLDQVNVSISLIISIAYPQGDQKKEALEQAREILRSLDQFLLKEFPSQCGTPAGKL